MLPIGYSSLVTTNAPIWETFDTGVTVRAAAFGKARPHVRIIHRHACVPPCAGPCPKTGIAQSAVRSVAADDPFEVTQRSRIGGLGPLSQRLHPLPTSLQIAIEMRGGRHEHGVENAGRVAWLADQMKPGHAAGFVAALATQPVKTPQQ